jgi:hypothetical protein
MNSIMQMTSALEGTNSMTAEDKGGTSTYSMAMHAQNSNCERIHLNAKEEKNQLFGVRERLSGLLGSYRIYQDILQELENEGFN